jgi:predicted ATPase
MGVAQLPTASLADVAALRLLVDRAQAVAPEFVLTDGNREGAIEICRDLDGLPLAIELAAVRLGSLGVDDLAERLEDRFRLLASDRQPGSERHSALRATVEWSHELLGEVERILGGCVPAEARRVVRGARLGRGASVVGLVPSG